MLHSTIIVYLLQDVCTHLSGIFLYVYVYVYNMYMYIFRYMCMDMSLYMYMDMYMYMHMEVSQNQGPQYRPKIPGLLSRGHRRKGPPVLSTCFYR